MKQRASPLGALARLDDLRSLAAAPGPFLSVHLSLRPVTHDLPERLALAWRGDREAVAAAGAPPELLEQVDDVLAGSPHRSGAGLTFVASPGGRPHVEHLSVPPPVDLVEWQAVPVLAPLIAARQLSPPHLVALVDRSGADLMMRPAGAQEGRESSVDGADFPLTKTHAGGWSQRRIQQRAEETWQKNMADLARRLTEVADRVDPAVVAVGGDVRATTLLREELPERIVTKVRSISPTRAEDGSAEAVDEEVERLLRDHVEEELARTDDVYNRELRQEDQATAGVADTVAAIREARVAVLLTTPRLGSDERHAIISADHKQVASRRGDLPDQAGAQEAPLIDAVVAAALTTDADVRIVADEASPPEGIGALLRW